MTEEYFEPAKYGDTLGDFIAKMIYNTPKVGLREGLTNIRDEYNDPSTQKHDDYMCARVEINSVRRTLKMYDEASGIKDLEDFKRFFNTEHSKQVGDIVSTATNPNDEVIGLFHVGKASFLKMSRKQEGEVVYFRSNNGQEGVVLPMMLRNGRIGWGVSSRYPKEHASLARTKIGLTVEVVDVVDELLDLSRLQKMIGEWFGILIRRGFKIFVRDTAIDGSMWTPVRAPDGLETNETHRTPELQLKDGRYISHCLKSTLKPKWLNLDLYQHHIYIKSMHVDFCLYGWVNSNSWGLNGSRDGFQTDGPDGALYIEGMSKLDKFFELNFDRQHGDATKITFQKDMDRELEKMLAAANLTFENDPLTLSGKASQKSNLRGIITGDIGQRAQLIIKDNQSLTDSGGGKDGPIVIPIGNGTRTDGGRNLGGGDGPSAESGGSHKVLTNSGEDNRPRTGNIKPKASIIKGKIGETSPICQMNPDGNVLILNEERPATGSILKLPIQQRLAMLRPMMAGAIIDHMTKGTRITINEYRTKADDLITATILGARV